MHMCCQGVCEVCKLALLELQSRFDPFVFKFFIRAGVLCGWILDRPCSGFTTDLSPGLDGFYSDWNQKKT